jgi:hypothetical protein
MMTILTMGKITLPPGNMTVSTILIITWVMVWVTSRVIVWGTTWRTVWVTR